MLVYLKKEDEREREKGKREKGGWKRVKTKE